MKPPDVEKIWELMPTTSPCMLKSGPPELPGLTATSVWMNGTYWSLGRLRESAETMPAVTVLSRPNGLPMAATHSPTLSLLESPILSTGRSFASILMTAMSVCLSEPSTLPLNSRLSVRRTMSSPAPSTTWAFVMMMPSEETMKPEPVPRCSGISCGPKSKGMPKRRKISAPRGSRPGMPAFSTVRALRIIWMFTTPGPLSSTSFTKSGSCTCCLSSEPPKMVTPAVAGTAMELMTAATARESVAERAIFDANMLFS